MLMTRRHGGLGWAGDPCGMSLVASAQTGVAGPWRRGSMDGRAWAGVADPRDPGDCICALSHWPSPLSFSRLALSPWLRACELSGGAFPRSCYKAFATRLGPPFPGPPLCWKIDFCMDRSAGPDIPQVADWWSRGVDLEWNGRCSRLLSNLVRACRVEFSCFGEKEVDDS